MVFLMFIILDIWVVIISFMLKVDKYCIRFLIELMVVINWSFIGVENDVCYCNNFNWVILLCFVWR